MTEQTPKLDVKTLEYVRTFLKREHASYIEFARLEEKHENLDEAKFWREQAATLSFVSNFIRRSISEQQEA